ncbi:RNA-directed DNA polymerase from mobile element jockey [Paramuricea clavata]|uniref:RNA-directed DNA polymerase from mobile element jockey n=1 Tax=Paramuricea clavata TaxID=317549 RepID=A0A7D9HNX5_PARCT|nr:RNA-directed DNA polymerase from mobile element jockey [Paramuricea clavata]
MIKNSRSDCSTGPDNIPVIFLKLAADFLAGPFSAGPLTAIINNCIDSLKYPMLWKLARISPIPKIDNPEHAKHSRHGASAATSDKAGGLDAVLFLSTKAEVMLTCNLLAEVGLCNGSFGTIEQIWFAENLGPLNLPIAVLVRSFHDIVFEPMTFDRLKAIGRSKNMQNRLEAEERLKVRAEKTVQTYNRS